MSTAVMMMMMCFVSRVEGKLVGGAHHSDKGAISARCVGRETSPVGVARRRVRFRFHRRGERFFPLSCLCLRGLVALAFAWPTAPTREPTGMTFSFSPRFSFLSCSHPVWMESEESPCCNQPGSIDGVWSARRAAGRFRTALRSNPILLNNQPLRRRKELVGRSESVRKEEKTRLTCSCTDRPYSRPQSPRRCRFVDRWCRLLHLSGSETLLSSTSRLETRSAMTVFICVYWSIFFHPILLIEADPCGVICCNLIGSMRLTLPYSFVNLFHLVDWFLSVPYVSKTGFPSLTFCLPLR